MALYAPPRVHSPIETRCYRRAQVYCLQARTLMAQGYKAGTLTVTATGVTNWTCPLGVYRVFVDAGAASGGSSGHAIATSGRGGGAGAYAGGWVKVVPGRTYTITVGVGGTAGLSSGATTAGDGGDTSFADGATVLILAAGGKGGVRGGLGGAGGLAANCVGTTVFSGGSGGQPGAGGGGSGGKTGAGGDAAVNAAGAAGTGLFGSAGAAGTTNPGASGGVPGGAPSGGTGTGAASLGTAGSRGELHLTW